MRKRADEVLVGDRLHIGTIIREVKDIEPRFSGEGDTLGVTIIFKEKRNHPRMSSYKPATMFEIEEPTVVSTEDIRRAWQEHVDYLKSQGFEPTGVWRAIKNHQILAETSHAEDFRAFGFMDDPEVSFRQVYSKTESIFVLERPDV